MFFFFIAVLAGILTILAPCIFPLLPIIIGSTEPGTNKLPRRAIVVILSLSVSVIIFTLLLKASTLLIVIPPSFWQYFSGGVIMIAGLALLFPDVWAKVPVVRKLSVAGDKALRTGHQQKNMKGDALMGMALGPVFTSCSPTYLYIVATILPARFSVGLIYLLGFVLGLAFSLFLVAYFGQKIVNKVTRHSAVGSWVKKGFAVLIIVVGLAIFTGYEKKFEAFILDSGYGATIDFEGQLIKRFRPQENTRQLNQESKINMEIPSALRSSFPNTDWNKANPIVAGAISGGVRKDGISSLDEPKFEPIADISQPDSVQAIVLKEGSVAKVFPYNILTWHEIVNDTVDGVPVAVTFCPLCGSAIVYRRDLSRSVTTFGVSGWLYESNLIMYDRDTESLWQQSTGKAMAGEYFGEKLALVPFQLMTIGEVKEAYPAALVLSEDTGFIRDYSRNPYSGYEESEDFVFSPSSVDERFHPKTIMVAFFVNEQAVAFPWLSIQDGQERVFALGQETVTLLKENGELRIVKGNGDTIPFYFEMWFSWSVQHGEDGIVPGVV